MYNVRENTSTLHLHMFDVFIYFVYIVLYNHIVLCLYAILCIDVPYNVTQLQIRLKVGLRKLCWHNLEHNRHTLIMLA